MVQYFTPAEKYNETGILQYFYGKNNLENIILTSSVGNPLNALIYDKYFTTASSDEIEQYIQVELKNKVLLLTHYYINCHTADGPLSWNFSVSPNGIEWSVFHAIKNKRTSLNGNVVIPTKTVGVRFMRWTQTDKSGIIGKKRYNYMRIDEFDIFGILYEIDEYYRLKWENCSKNKDKITIKRFITCILLINK